MSNSGPPATATSMLSITELIMRQTNEASLAGVCAELLQLIRARSKRILDERHFINQVRSLEEEVLSPNGMTVSLSAIDEEWSHIALRSTGTQEVHATFQFRVTTGEVKTAGVPTVLSL